MLELDLGSEADTVALARVLAALLEPGDVIGLEGGLGAGKTTFTRAAVHGLGVPEEIAVTSPTFALLHQYQGRLPIAHADFYRLGDEAELEAYYEKVKQAYLNVYKRCGLDALIVEASGGSFSRCWRNEPQTSW